MARDDFPKNVIEKLKNLVSNKCSNPECRCPTSAASEGGKHINIGKAAHICAAAPGGPRYDANMSTADRKSIDNGIWLCSNCSTKIDRDEIKYSVSLLKSWRLEAENTSRNELGKRQINNNDTIDTVAVALTGYPKRFIEGSISNVHKGAEKALENLDPRFNVKSAQIEGITSFSISAKQEVPISMKISSIKVTEFIEKYQQFLENGQDIEINANGITFEGSRLIEELFGDEQGVLIVSQKKLKAIQKLWLIEDVSKEIFYFDEIQGELSSGNKSLFFNGSSCNNIVKFNYLKSLNEHENIGSFTMSFALENWEGLKLNSIPFFDKVFSLISNLENGWEIFTSLELNGQRIIATKGDKGDQWDKISEVSNFLNYTNRCKIIAEYLKKEIVYTLNTSFTAEEHNRITEVVEVIQGKQIFDKGNFKGELTCNITLNEFVLNTQLQAQPLDVIAKMSIALPVVDIKLFGVFVKMPSRIITVEYVVPKIIWPQEKLKIGDIVKVELIPQNNFKCKVSYG